MLVDYLIVGAGLTGATIARMLHDAGRRVLVVERRDHLGGNVHDYVHPSGIRIHTYGPHYFRTSSASIWTFVNRFSVFYRYDAVIASLVDGRYESWPVSRQYIERTAGDAWAPCFLGIPSNFEEASLRMMPRSVYDKFIKGYTEKQWGVAAARLSPALATRFTVRDDSDPRLSHHRFQGLPIDGYAALTRRMLAGIPAIVDCDYLRHRECFPRAGHVVYTGAIDEFFDWCFGKLQYRGQLRRHEYLTDVDRAQPYVQVNNPNPSGGPHIRTIEWKHLMPSAAASRIRGTVVTRETPTTPTDPDRCEYPFPDEPNRLLYERYRALADRRSDVSICGRLGDYRYYDMDQAIGRAMRIAARLIERRPSTDVSRRGGETRAVHQEVAYAR